MAVSTDDVRRAAATYLDPEHAVTVIERPLLSHDTLYLLLGSALALGSFAVAWRYGPRRRRRASGRAP